MSDVAKITDKELKKNEETLNSVEEFLKILTSNVFILKGVFL
ncbi:hypothetical protein [Streptococcus henryi]|nr:hypothetical protein [Streptococcus henryi]